MRGGGSASQAAIPRELRAPQAWALCVARALSNNMDDLLIQIEQDMPGFNPFFGAWLIVDNTTLLVDVGPASTSRRLIESLKELVPEGVDYILLTHIHIDHAGALGPILDAFPAAKAVCHEKAVEHLVDPSGLWNGSVKVLGDLARTYGKPEPVPRERLIPHTECNIDNLTVLETPGHAVHHLSYSYMGRLFVGEAAGNYLKVGDLDYLRPATPPRFFLHLFLKSIELLLELEDQPIRYAHFGEAASSHRMLRTFRDQLLLWESLIAGLVSKHENDEDITEKAIDLLLKRDPNLAAFYLMDPDTQKRERLFMANGIKGFVEFLRERR